VAVSLAGQSIPADDSVAVATRKSARLVVFGDRHLFIDGYLGQLGNRDLLLNTLRWLGGQVDQITIAPKESADTPLILREGQLMMISLVSVVALPLAVIFTGLFVWFRRRAKR
jgi:gliding motility-associatede transport system auxiliary component